MTRSIMGVGAVTCAVLSTKKSDRSKLRNDVARILIALLVGSASVTATACAQPANSARAAAVATPTTLAGQIASAKSGQTILLGDGAYGPLVIRGRQFGAPGLIIRAKPGAKPVFTSVAIAHSEGVELADVEVHISAAQYGVAVAGGSRVKFSRLKIHALQQPPPSAMFLRDTRDVVVEDCEIYEASFGINFLNSERLKILRNSFRDLQVDAIRGSASYSEVIGNRATNFHPKPGDHPDFIQIWGSQAGPSKGNVIKDNVYQRGDGEVVQGIFLEDNEDVEVRGNALLGPMYNGIGLARVHRATIEDNFVQGYKDMGTRIITRGKSSDVLIRNNVSQAVVEFNDGGQPNPRYKAERNQSIKPANIGDATAMHAWLAKRAGS